LERVTVRDAFAIIPTAAPCAAGGFSGQEAHQLAATLNAGSLPAKLSADPVSEDYLTMTLGLNPATRFVFKCAAIALALFACVLFLARMLLRRFRPTVGDEMDRMSNSPTS
jgi:preprotein translocase subunit SecD